MRRLLLLAACLAGPAAADTDFSDLSPTERAILGQEIRAVLLTLPELLPRDAPRGAPEAEDLYAKEIASDLARLKAHRAALFSPNLPGFGPLEASHTIALFTRSDCPDCARAEADLRTLAERYDLRVTLLDMDGNSELADSLDLDKAPGYVFPDKMLRGHIPSIVLERYLDD